MACGARKAWCSRPARSSAPGKWRCATRTAGASSTACTPASRTAASSRDQWQSHTGEETLPIVVQAPPRHQIQIIPDRLDLAAAPLTEVGLTHLPTGRQETFVFRAKQPVVWNVDVPARHTGALPRAGDALPGHRRPGGAAALRGRGPGARAAALPAAPAGLAHGAAGRRADRFRPDPAGDGGPALPGRGCMASTPATRWPSASARR